MNMNGKQTLTKAQQDKLVRWREIMAKAWGNRNGYRCNKGGWVIGPGFSATQGWSRFYEKHYKQIWVDAVPAAEGETHCVVCKRNMPVDPVWPENNICDRCAQHPYYKRMQERALEAR